MCLRNAGPFNDMYLKKVCNSINSTPPAVLPHVHLQHVTVTQLLINYIGRMCVHNPQCCPTEILLADFFFLDIAPHTC